MQSLHRQPRPTTKPMVCEATFISFCRWAVWVNMLENKHVLSVIHTISLSLSFSFFLFHSPVHKAIRMLKTFVHHNPTVFSFLTPLSKSRGQAPLAATTTATLPSRSSSRTTKRTLATWEDQRAARVKVAAVGITSPLTLTSW